MSRSGKVAIIRAGLVGTVLISLAAAAQAQPAASSDSVIVNWGALDALGSGGSGAAGIAAVTLTAPPRRVVATPTPPPEKPAERPSGPAPSGALAPPAPTLAPEPSPGTSSPPPAAPAAQKLALASAPRAVGAASLPPGRVTMVRFGAGASDIPEDGKSALDAAAASLAADPKARLQLVAYASGSADDPVAARRVSLTRAVQMRSYLIAKGVPSVRMEVRALGDQNVGSGPADRVDLVIVDR